MPTSYEPVNVIPSTSGLSCSSCPTWLPGPVMKWNAPSGTPPSRSASASLTPMNAPAFDGFRTTVLPVTSAAPTGPPASAIGKLNGLMTAHTPYGRRTS